MRAAILDGIVLGLQFGLLGVGLTLVYGLGGVLNLAHGQIAVLAAITVAASRDAGMPVVAAVATGLVVAMLVGLILERTILQPVYRQRGEHRVVSSLLLMLGVAFVIDGYLSWRDPIAALSLRIGGDTVNVLGVAMTTGHLMASGVTVMVGVVLVLFFRYTTSGKAIRSVIQDEDGARLCGINPALARTLIFGLSSGLAGLVAVTRSMTSPVTVTAGPGFTIFALIVAVVGGLGSVSGAFLAGVLLGVVSAVSRFYIGQYITEIVLLLAAALTIVLRPSGLLGRSS
jgi:branched-chain amino acid transport system permease protein